MMGWSDPLKSILSDKPPANSQDLARELKAFLWQLHAKVNLLLDQGFWYKTDNAGGANAGSGVAEEWNASLAITAKLKKKSLYLMAWNGTIDLTDMTQEIAFEIYDVTGTAVLATQKNDAGVNMRIPNMIVRTLFAAPSDGIRQFTIRATSGFAASQTAGTDDLFTIQEVPYAS